MHTRAIDDRALVCSQSVSYSQTTDRYADMGFRLLRAGDYGISMYDMLLVLRCLLCTNYGCSVVLQAIMGYDD